MNKKSFKRYYRSKKSKILSNFDDQINVFRKVLLVELGTAKTENILKEMKEEYITLIPEIIFLESEKNFLLREFKTISIALAFTKIMKRHDYSKEEIIVYIYNIQKEWYFMAINGRMNSMRIFFNIIQAYPFNKLYSLLIRKYEKRINKKGKKSSIQIHYVKGDRVNFDYGIDILHCPICDFWKKHDASDILPYICLFDFFKSAMMNSGLIRTMTLSEGFIKCDNRFKRGEKPQNRQKTQFLIKKRKKSK